MYLQTYNWINSPNDILILEWNFLCIRKLLRNPTIPLKFWLIENLSYLFWKDFQKYVNFPAGLKLNSFFSWILPLPVDLCLKKVKKKLRPNQHCKNLLFYYFLWLQHWLWYEKQAKNFRFLNKTSKFFCLYITIKLAIISEINWH